MVTPLQNQVSQQQLRIPVVEDDMALHSMFTHAFNFGPTLYLGATFEEGWRSYVNRDPHIVFLNVSLPNGNGHDLARLIKKRNRATYVVMSPWIDDKKEAAHNHVDGFVTKPLTKHMFKNYVDWCRAENSL